MLLQYLESYVVNARQKAQSQLSDLHNFQSSHKDALPHLSQKELELAEYYLKQHSYLLDARSKEIETGKEVVLHGLTYSNDVSRPQGQGTWLTSIYKAVWPFGSHTTTDDEASLRESRA